MSSIRFIPSEPGIVKCKAKNSFGSTHTNGLVQISDLLEPFTILNLNDDQIADGDHVILECGAIKYNYTNDIKWLRDGELIIADDRITIVDQNTKFSWRKSLIFNSITKDDEGVYRCEIIDTNQQAQQRDFHMRIFEAITPIITSNFDQPQVIQPIGGSLTLECLFTGLPKPSIKW